MGKVTGHAAWLCGDGQVSPSAKEMTEPQKIGFYFIFQTERRIQVRNGKQRTVLWAASLNKSKSLF